MTGPLYFVVRWFLNAVPVDDAGRRVFDETLADWRKEAAAETGRLDRVRVAIRGASAIARSLVMVSVREVTSPEGMAPLRRLAGWSIVSVLLFFFFNWNQSVHVQGTRVVLGPGAVALGSVAWVVALMPLLAFVSAAWGRRGSKPVLRLGPALVMSVVMLGMMGWAVPAANQAWREIVFGLSGGRGTIPPSIGERSIIELVGLLATRDFLRVISQFNLRMLFVVGVPVLLVLGSTARSLTGSRRVAGSVLPLLVLSIPLLAGIAPVYRELALWPALLAAVLVVRVFVTESRKERNTGPRGSAASPGVIA